MLLCEKSNKYLMYFEYVYYLQEIIGYEFKITIRITRHANCNFYRENIYEENQMRYRCCEFLTTDYLVYLRGFNSFIAFNVLRCMYDLRTNYLQRFV